MNSGNTSAHSLKFRLLSFILAFAMFFSVFSCYGEIFAADYGETYYEDNDTALDLYDALGDFIESVAESGGSTVYTYSLSYTATGSFNTVCSAWYDEVEMANMLNVLLADYPYDLYWFNKTSGITISYGGTTSGSKATLTSVKFTFSVISAYQGSTSTSVSTSMAAEAKEAKENAQDIVDEYSSLDDVEEILTAYKEEICSLTSYNYSAASSSTYSDAYQLTYVFDGDTSTKVVCEGYAKAFQYLCDLTWPDNDPVTCYTVTGTMSGGTGAGTHMWNIISYNGKSYLVDLTNSDSGTLGSDGSLFLADASSASGSYSSGYTFTISSTALKYVYDSSTLGLYPSSVLKLSTTAFPSGSSTTSISGATVTLGYSTVTYSGSAKTPSVTVKLSGTTLTKGTDYTVSYSDNTDVGTATVTITGIGDYTGTVTKTFKITAKSISSASVSLSSSSFTYNGAAKKPTVTVKITLNSSTKTLTSGTDYTVSYSNNTDAGTATVKITGKGNYTGSVSKTFTIKQRSINSSSTGKATVSLSSTSFTYNGAAKKPTVTVKMTLNGSTKTLTKGTDYTVTYSNNTNAGTATVKITGTGNFTGTITKTFTIKQRSINSSSTGKATVTLGYTSTTYSGSARKPSVTVKMTLNSATKTLTKGTDYTVTYSNNTSIGKATVKITGKGNFTGTITKTFTIKPKQVTISSAKSSSSKKITVKWTKLSGNVKYQIAYKKKGASSWTYKTVSASTVSKTLTGLTSGKTYYVKVRAYKTVSGTTYYGSWSSQKTVTVK